MSNRQTDLLIHEIDKVIGPPSGAARPEVVYLLGPSGRIGHLAGELFFLRCLYPPDDYDVIVIVGDERNTEPSLNPAVLEKFTEGMRHVFTEDNTLLQASLEDTGEPVRENRRYVLVSYFTLLAQYQLDCVDKNNWHFHHLNADEERRGAEAFQRLNLSPDVPTITLHIRDPGYLPDKTYHSYRNADPSFYEPVISQILDAGYNVVRLGDKKMIRLSFTHPNLVELPFAEGYEPFDDLFFVARSMLYIGTKSGPCDLAHAFDVPVLFLNTPITSHIYGLPRDLFVFKSYFSHLFKRALSYEEIMMDDLPELDETIKFARRDVELVENSPREILIAFSEMVMRMDGNHTAVSHIDAALAKINEAAHAARLDGSIANALNDCRSLLLSKASFSHAVISASPGFLPEAPDDT